MDSATYTRLAALGAPLAPLDAEMHRFVRARTGHVWHRSPLDMPQSRSGCCAPAQQIATRDGALARTVSVGAAIREDLECCTNYGCRLESPANHVAILLANALRSADRFDEAVAVGAWQPAASALDQLRRSVERAHAPFAIPDTPAVSGADWVAAHEWAAAFLPEREAILDAALCQVRQAVIRAAGAWNTAPGVSTELIPELLRVTHHTWQNARESLMSDAQVVADVHAAVTTACLRLEEPFVPKAVIDVLIDTWDAEASVEGPLCWSVLWRDAQTMRPSSKDDDVSGWVSMAVAAFPTVTNGSAGATLIPAVLAERVRYAFIVSERPADLAKQAHIAPCDPDEFHATATTALTLWDRNFQSSSAFAAPEHAWLAAATLVTQDVA